MAKIERQKRIYRKRIPYGMQNFEDVMERDCYYVDKTPFIEKIEESNMYFFFIRPRRFGKSLTLSMLENYYDINKKDKFESLFGKLYIGENPTPERNSYLILHLNFAMISAGLDNYKKGLDAHCNNKFNSFCSRYAHLLPPDIKEEMNQKEDAVAQLGFLCDKCAEAGLKIYLFIDEYDHFTNQILAHKEHEKRYREQTHGEGYLRHFFDTIKGAAGDSLGRVFVTGVRHIGEVALVPASSPINRCGKLFYNTLFDENAACHIAFGDSYPGTTVGGTGLTREQLDARGMNHSSLHEDVMIGAEDSEITGKCRDGRTVQLFQNGVWVL